VCIGGIEKVCIGGIEKVCRGHREGVHGAEKGAVKVVLMLWNCLP